MKAMLVPESSIQRCSVLGFVPRKGRVMVRSSRVTVSTLEIVAKPSLELKSGLTIRDHS